VGDLLLDDGAFLEAAARAVALVADAGGIHVGAAGLTLVVAGHLLDAGDWDLLAHRVRDLAADALPDVGGAGDLLDHIPAAPPLAAALLRRLLAAHLHLPRAAAGLAGARIEAAIAARLPARVAAAGLAVGLGLPVPALLDAALIRRHRAAHRLAAFLVARLDA